jgi:hypothetical protein
MLCSFPQPWNTTNLVPNSQHRYNPPTQPQPTPSRPRPSLPHPHPSSPSPHPSSQASPSNAPMDSETTSIPRRSPRWCVSLIFCDSPHQVRSDVCLWGDSGSEPRDRQSRRGHRARSAHRTRTRTLVPPPFAHVSSQVFQARALASRRGARYLTAEDLIFLIRHDRGKVNRLRTYLSWKDVRKHAKDSGGDGGGGVEVETLEDGADGTSPFTPSYTLLTFFL